MATTARSKTPAKRESPEFKVAWERLLAWLKVRGILSPEAHLYEHGRSTTDPDHAIYMCSGWSAKTCQTQYIVDATRPPTCPRCHGPGTPMATSHGPAPEDTCDQSSAWGSCSYHRSCELCGVSVVLHDLVLALADRESRMYEIELLHEIAKSTRLYERARFDASRARVLRETAPRLQRAMNGYMRGRAAHLEKTTAAVRKTEAAMRAKGIEPQHVEPRPTERTFDEVLQRLTATRGGLGLASPDGSPRRPHVDPDRQLLGDLQYHLLQHGLSYTVIAMLLPDGEGGTAGQKRRRVETRLRQRRRAAEIVLDGSAR